MEEAGVRRITRPFQGKRGRLLMAAVFAGALSALTALLALAAPHRSFLHVATNLSTWPGRTFPSSSRASAFADVAISPDGDRVAVVWPEAYQDGGSARGSVFLRWASESTGNGWSSGVQVFAGSAEQCAVRAAVAMTGTTAYVAYVTWSPCDNPSYQTIYYQTYQLGQALGTPQEVTRAVGLGTDPGLTDVDIALDGEGNPHFVYAYFDRTAGGDVGSLYYTWFKDGQKKPQERVSDPDQNARRPAIAWSGDAIHVTWMAEVAVQGGKSYRIYYRRRTLGEGGTWGELRKFFDQGTTYPPFDPDVAACGDQVYVVWDIGYECQEVSSQIQCLQFTLAYIRSGDYGSSWPIDVGGAIWCEVGGTKRGQVYVYTSTNSQSIWEYGQFLRPSVALDGQGKPTVAWHVNYGSQSNPNYDILYREAESVPADTSQCISWSEPISLTQNRNGQSASPVVVRSSVSDTYPYLAYVWSSTDSPQAAGADWETYYDGNAYGDYPHVFLPVVFRNYVGGSGGGGGEG